MMSDTIKPLPDTVLEGLMRLPLAPARPVVGQGFANAGFPRLNSLFLKRLWCAIPAAHKHEDRGVISAEAYDVVKEFLL